MRVLCLANSKKLGGRCIAGIDVDSGRWIRPVHRRQGGEFYPYELLYEDGSSIDLLDVFQFAEKGEAGTLYHPEDVLAEGAWDFDRPASAKDFKLVKESLDSGPELLGSCGDSLAEPTDPEDAIEASLAVIRPGGRIIFRKEHRFNKAKFRVNFKLNGQFYDLALTDPAILTRMSKLSDGDYQPDAIGVDANPYLTISLSEPFEVTGRCYKLVAAVFPR